MTTNNTSDTGAKLLESWLSDEQRVAAVLQAGVGCGVATHDMVAGKTGRR